MAIKCPKRWMNCDGPGDWISNTSAFIILGMIFSAALFIQLVILTVQFSKIQASDRKRMRQLRITVVNGLTTLVRLIWWPFNLFNYVQYSTPLITRTFLNRFAFLLTYLGQSFYVQTWLLVLIAYTKRIGQRGFKIVFGVLDTLISITMGVGICATVLAPKDYQNSSVDTIYEIGSITMAVASIALVIAYPVIAMTVMCRLKPTFQCCSQRNISLMVVTAILLACNFSRAWCLFYQYSHHGAYMKNDTFQAFCYLIPDNVSIQTLTIMQFKQYLTQKKEVEHAQRSTTTDGISLHPRPTALV